MMIVLVVTLFTGCIGRQTVRKGDLKEESREYNESSDEKVQIISNQYYKICK